MDPVRIAVRCLASFIVLFTLVRISGKRALSEGTAFDFVLTLVIGDLVDDAIFAEVPFANFVVAAGTLVIMEITASILAHRSDRWMWSLEGKPAILLVQGRLNPDGLSHEQLNEKDISCLLRLEGLEKEKWGQVQLATIEAEGQSAVLKTHARRGAQKKDKKSLEHRNA